MGNNPLQAQLLKAGLVNKKQIGKVKQEQYQNRKQKEPVQATVSQAEQLAAAERSRELNRQLVEEKRRHELQAQIKQLIETNRLKRDQRGCPYYFPVQGKKVDRIFVAEEMAEQLSLGLLAIVKSKDGVEVVPVKVARQIAERDPAVVLVLHDGGKENEHVA
jgi:uncharacterized protein YaiL (DUF2058 family)